MEVLRTLSNGEYAWVSTLAFGICTSVFGHLNVLHLLVWCEEACIGPFQHLLRGEWPLNGTLGVHILPLCWSAEPGGPCCDRSNTELIVDGRGSTDASVHSAMLYGTIAVASSCSDCPAWTIPEAGCTLGPRLLSLHDQSCSALPSAR